MPKHHHKDHQPKHYSSRPSQISIFIRNEVKQESHQEHKDQEEQIQNSGCMAWLKKLCKCSS